MVKSSVGFFKTREIMLKSLLQLLQIEHCVSLKFQTGKVQSAMFRICM